MDYLQHTLEGARVYVYAIIHRTARYDPVKAEALRAKMRRMEEEEIAAQKPPAPPPTGYTSVYTMISFLQVHICHFNFNIVYNTREQQSTQLPCCARYLSRYDPDKARKMREKFRHQDRKGGR